MDREPAGVHDAGSGAPETRPARRVAAFGLVAIVALLVAVAVLATRLVSAAPAVFRAFPGVCFAFS